MKLAIHAPIIRQAPFRRTVLILAAVLLCLLQSRAVAQFVSGVDAVGITVSEMDRAVDFYSKVLTFQKVSDTEIANADYEHLTGVFGARARIVRMRLGDEYIELTEFLAPRGRPIPLDSRSNDLWFQHIAIIVPDIGRAYRWLRDNKVEMTSSGPQKLPEWNKNAAGIVAFYFKDADGHPLEILQFPPDKGLAKWHQITNKLFLGIDHTAIVIRDTQSSLHFYRDVLGLRVAGESENYGTEQEHLNNVFGARIRITALRGATGPGIEFLQYLTPSDGRAFPADEKANDLVHRETHLVAASPDTVVSVLRKEGTEFVSSGVISNQKEQLGFESGLLVRDPDGHPVAIIRK